VLGVVHVFGELRQRSRGAASNSRRMAALPPTFEPAKLEEGEELLVPRLHP